MVSERPKREEKERLLTDGQEETQPVLACGYRPYIETREVQAPMAECHLTLPSWFIITFRYSFVEMHASTGLCLSRVTHDKITATANHKVQKKNKREK
jgi:hypothetical protein